MSMRAMGAVLIAGWLAQQLASPDRDIEQGIAAYEAGNYEEALVHFDAAQERRGEQPEIAFDRGLVLLAKGDTEGARAAFERASEAEDPLIRASAFYELGNMAFDAEDWDGAIAHYIDALKARPDHANAKWNLELALQRKKAEEDKKKEEEEKQEDEKQEDEKQKDEKQEEEKPEDEKQDEKKDGEQKDEEQPGEQEQDKPEQPEGEEPPPDPSEPDQQDQKEQPQPSSQGEPPQQAKPMDQVDLDKALEQLDHQDAFRLDRPAGGYVRPKKDW